ncbi:MAG TPA: hypothetical protein VF495_11275 [Phenylobacterium sp.]
MDYPEASAELARRLRWWLGIGFGGIFAAMGVAGLLALVSPVAAGLVLVMSMFVYLVAWIFVCTWLYGFVCPRCEKRWFAIVRVSPAWGNTRCAGCKMPRESL